MEYATGTIKIVNTVVANTPVYSELVFYHKLSWIRSLVLDLNRSII